MTNGTDTRAHSTHIHTHIKKNTQTHTHKHTYTHTHRHVRVQKEVLIRVPAQRKRQIRTRAERDLGDGVALCPAAQPNVALKHTTFISAQRRWSERVAGCVCVRVCVVVSRRSISHSVVCLFVCADCVLRHLLSSSCLPVPSCISCCLSVTFFSLRRHLDSCLCIYLCVCVCVFICVYV